MKYFLSLGSNLGNRRANLARAAGLLREKGLADPPGLLHLPDRARRPARDQPWFYNQVLEVDAAYNPLALLNVVKSIEQMMKRVPTVDKGPRTIDIDILLAGRTVVQTRRLMIPHPRMDRQEFRPRPSARDRPSRRSPSRSTNGSTDLAKRSGDTAVVRKLGPAPAGRPAAVAGCRNPWRAGLSPSLIPTSIRGPT